MEKIRVYFEEGNYYLLTNDKKILVEFPDGNAPDCGEGCADINVKSGSLDTYTKDSVPEIKLIVDEWELC